MVSRQVVSRQVVVLSPKVPDVAKQFLHQLWYGPHASLSQLHFSLFFWCNHINSVTLPATCMQEPNLGDSDDSYHRTWMAIVKDSAPKWGSILEPTRCAIAHMSYICIWAGLCMTSDQGFGSPHAVPSPTCPTFAYIWAGLCMTSDQGFGSPHAVPLPTCPTLACKQGCVWLGCAWLGSARAMCRTVSVCDIIIKHFLSARLCKMSSSVPANFVCNIIM